MSKTQKETATSKAETVKMHRTRKLEIIAGSILIGILLILGSLWLFNDGGSDEPIDKVDIDASLDEGTCSADFAAELDRLAGEVNLEAESESPELEIEQKALLYEQLLNCYIQQNDFENAVLAANSAEELYEQAGLIQQAEQMNSAANALQESLDFEEGQVVESATEEGDGGL